MKIKNIKDFKKLTVGDEIEYSGERYIISSVGEHCGEPYIGISDIIQGDGLELDDKPTPNTEYRLSLSEGENHIEPLCDLSFR